MVAKTEVQYNYTNIKSIIKLGNYNLINVELAAVLPYSIVPVPVIYVALFKWMVRDISIGTGDDTYLLMWVKEV